MANSTLFGALGLSESDSTYLNTIGAQIVYDAVAVTLEEHNSMVMASLELWVEGTTPNYKYRYKPSKGGGYLQRRRSRAKAAEIKAPLGWDVALPLEDFGAGFAADRIAFAYMTTQELDQVVATVMNQDIATVRFEALKALFNSGSRTFPDERKGDLIIQPLANGDSVNYPPLIGSDTSGTSNHYLGVAADSSAVTDANNQIPTIVNKLEGHFGTPSGGSEIVVFINDAQTAGVQALAGFDAVTNRYVTAGIANDRVELASLPPLPGRVLGVCNGAIIVEWRYIPANYMLGMHLGAAAPLMQRIDEPQANLPVGLALISEDYDHPFNEYEWGHRFGFGVANRLNGVIVDLKTGSSTYTIPPKYA